MNRIFGTAGRRAVAASGPRPVTRHADLRVSCMSDGARTVAREPRRPEGGQAMVETLIALPLVLLLIIGIVETSLIFRAKLLLNHAATMTVRTGALNHGCKGEMIKQLTRSLAPLHMRADRSFLKYQSAKITELISVRLYSHIEVLHPTRAIYDKHARKMPLTTAQIRPCAVGESVAALKPHTFRKVLPNDNLSYRNTAADLGGSGPDAYSIQDANLLKIRVRYCHELSTPFFDQLITAVQQQFMTGEDQVFLNYCLHAAGGTKFISTNQRFVVLSSEALFRMQTPLLRKVLDN